LVNRVNIMSQFENGEKFSETHHKIISQLGHIVSDIGASSGVMAILMSWGDTMNSEQTLDMLTEYVDKFLPQVNTQPLSQ
jgi:hypothetical protein